MYRINASVVRAKSAPYFFLNDGIATTRALGDDLISC